MPRSHSSQSNDKECSPGCGACIDEFADFQDTFQMYKDCDLELITVAANMPDEKPGVMKMLERKHATSCNLLFASNETTALQMAFDPAWDSAVPYTVLIDPLSRHR